MKVIILSGKKGHYYHTALGAQKAKCLHKFITTMYFKNPSKIIKNPLLRILGKNVSGWLESIVFLRSDNGLNNRLVIPISPPEILSQIASKFSNSLEKRVNLVHIYLFELLSIIHIDKCDIFHVCSGFGLLTSRIAKRKGAIIIIDQGSAHPIYRRNLLRSEYKRYGSKHLLPDELWMKKVIKEHALADYIFVPSQHVYNSFVENGVDSQKLFVIPYGVDINKFKPIPKNNNKFRIIYVGLLSLSKGVQYLLEAYKQLNLNNSELVLIGKVDDSFKSTLTEYKGLFTHISYVPNHELYKYYSDSSVFVLPSLTDSFGLTIFEAMACGIPPITTENCGAPICDGIDGFVIPIRDVEALKEKLFLLYTDDDLRKKMGKSAREHVSNFTWEKYGEEVVKAYQEILKLSLERKRLI